MARSDHPDARSGAQDHLRRYVPPGRVPRTAAPRPAALVREGVLVLGIGNRLMGDDGLGPEVVRRLSASVPDGTSVIDGGTCGLALLPLIESCASLIVIDAAAMGKTPGTVNIYEGAELDDALGSAQLTAHEVALSDLLAAAAATGALPARRALVAVEPLSVRVGCEMSDPVRDALPAAESAARTMIERWTP